MRCRSPRRWWLRSDGFSERGRTSGGSAHSPEEDAEDEAAPVVPELAAEEGEDELELDEDVGAEVARGSVVVDELATGSVVEAAGELVVVAAGSVVLAGASVVVVAAGSVVEAGWVVVSAAGRAKERLGRQVL